MRPVLVLIVASTTVGLVTFLVLLRSPRADPALEEARNVGEALRGEGRLRRFVRSRTDPAIATGLALSTSIVGFVIAGAIVGVLAWMIRRETWVVGIDRAVERWAERYATPFSDDVLEVVTHTGDTITIIVVGLLVAAFGIWRWRDWSFAVFVTVVISGQFLISNSIKFLIDRARPELRPRAHFTGTSFPSGHSTAAAATYLAIALVLSIGVSPRFRSLLLTIAVAIGVAVGTTRAFLGVHWFSDVVAGLAIGWAWFGLCAVAFGGRLMRFGAPAELASPGRERIPEASGTM